MAVSAGAILASESFTITGLIGNHGAATFVRAVGLV